MLKSKEDLRYYKLQDAVMNGFITTSLKRRMWIKLFSKKYRFLCLLREAEYYKNNNPSYLNKFLFLLKIYKLKKLGMRLGFTIEPNCFGPGLSLPHCGTIVVNGNARIGANCRLHCCTNIGASAGEKKAPQIGDNCYIGPGAILFGNIKIANNITIGANATVNHSFEEEHVAIAGTPARIVKRDMPNWLQLNQIKM